MNFKKIIFLLLIYFTLFPCNAQKNNLSDKSKPNIIYILADDLGYGDLSCYVQEKFATPNIDKLIVQQTLYILKIGIPFRQNLFNQKLKKF